jgi:hypothetical protein
MNSEPPRPTELRGHHLGLLLLVPVALVACLGATLVCLYRPHGPPRISTARTDAQTIRSAAMQYPMENGGCLKTGDVLEGTYLSPSTRLRDPWGEHYRIYRAPGDRCDGDVDVCSSGPNQRHGDEDDVCGGHPVRSRSEASAIDWNASPRPEPTRPRWTVRSSALQPNLEAKAPWKPELPTAPGCCTTKSTQRGP